VNNQLGDAIAAFNLIIINRVGVDHDHLQLTAVAAVDNAWRIDK